MTKEAEISDIQKHKVKKLTSEIDRLKKEIEKKDDLIRNMHSLFDILSSTLDIHTKFKKENDTSQSKEADQTFKRNTG